MRRLTWANSHLDLESRNTYPVPEPAPRREPVVAQGDSRSAVHRGERARAVLLVFNALDFRRVDDWDEPHKLRWRSLRLHAETCRVPSSRRHAANKAVAVTRVHGVWRENSIRGPERVAVRQHVRVKRAEARDATTFRLRKLKGEATKETIFLSNNSITRPQSLPSNSI